jgi:hypothetical protein
MGIAMEAKDIGGALAGGLIATELLGALVGKGILTNVDAHRLLLKALKAIDEAPMQRLGLTLRRHSAEMPAGTVTAGWPVTSKGQVLESISSARARSPFAIGL